MTKRRILLVNEASYLATGYANYGKQLMTKLHETGKYELAELASYGYAFDPRRFELPWLFYGNAANENDEAERKAYKDNIVNQFGAWRFEDVVKDFKPDVCISIRDYWMDFFINESPYRSKYHFVRMPTVDARPQNPEWIDDYAQCDRVVTYTDWAIDVLREDSGGRIDPICSCPPAVDLEEFHLYDKAKLRQSFGLTPNKFILGTVMRNQRRKLFPDLIASFASLLKKLSPEDAADVYLYLHTSYPDSGWDLPKLLTEYGIGHKTLFTYLCNKCGFVFPSLFHGPICVCPKCQNFTAKLPNTQRGVSREQLSQIYGLFDLYVQYHNSEGFGIPLVEAAACGIPVCGTDYSGPEDIIRKLGGYPIKVKHLLRESETNCLRAIPDNDDFVEYLLKFLRTPISMRTLEGQRTRQKCEQHYNWDLVASRWETVIDGLPVLEPNRWHRGSRFLADPYRGDFPQMNNADFIKFVAVNILNRPELLERYWFSRCLNDLNHECRVKQMGGIHVNTMSLIGQQDKFEPYDRNALLNDAYKVRQFWQHWERVRLGHVPYNPPYFIEYKKVAQS